MWAFLEDQTLQIRGEKKTFTESLSFKVNWMHLMQSRFQCHHPPPRYNFSLEIDLNNQTILICVQELKLFYSIQMELKLVGLFFQTSTRLH